MYNKILVTLYLGKAEQDDGFPIVVKRVKCTILPFDGLEYNFVKKFDLRNLKQEEDDKVTTPPECCAHANIHKCKKLKRAQ